VRLPNIRQLTQNCRIMLSQVYFDISQLLGPLYLLEQAPLSSVNIAFVRIGQGGKTLVQTDFLLVTDVACVPDPVLWVDLGLGH